MKRLPIKVFLLFSVLCSLFSVCLAQEPDLEFTLDVASQTIPLPKIFKPNIDLSGRGYHRDMSWPQGLAAPEVLETWQKDIGFLGLYRMQFNLWEIHQLAKNKEAQDKLLSNYENVIKRISDSGGIVILDIFGTPAGLGKVLDKKSPPVNLKAFQELIEGCIKNLSCDKHYHIWYEVWSAPDLDDFFLGRRQDYLNLYRTVAEAINELEGQSKIQIPLGAPATSSWFQDTDTNTNLTPEHSLIYELIKFSYHYHLPLDFITWHGFSTDPALEKEQTIYKKPVLSLIRDWLTYFKLKRDTLLIVDEWNYDRGTNLLPERRERSYIAASYIPSRLKNMYQAGLDNQLYFSLEDFQNNKEGVVRNTGVFWFDPEASAYKGGPKAVYNVYQMLAQLGEGMFSAPGLSDEFVGVIASRGKDSIAILIYNYIDPDIAVNFISRNIAVFDSAERKFILDLIKSDKFLKIMRGELDITTLRTTKEVKNLLHKAKELNNSAAKFKDTPRSLKITLKNLGGDYTYQKYVVDSACATNCKFAPLENKDIVSAGTYQETLEINPYSLNLIILKPKPKEPEAAVVPAPAANPPASAPTNAGDANKTKKE